MGSEWAEDTFEVSSIQILDGDRGKNYPKKSEFTESGHCLFLNTGNVTKDGFKFDSTDFVSVERDQLLKKGKLQRGDVVLTTRGTVGNVAYFNDSVPFDDIRINSGMVILRSEGNEILPRYLYLFLRSKLFKTQVDVLQSGSAQPQLPIRDIKRIKVKIPSPTEQKAIAHVLGSLDDKIELNRQMNETLEAMAQALFKSWFVDFDPVIDNALAAGNAIPDAFAKRAEQRKAQISARKATKEPENSHQSLFPCEFEFTEEMGWIPKGWGVVNLLEIIDLIGGGTPKTTIEEYWNGSIPWFSVVDAPSSSDVFVNDTEKHVTELGVEKSSTKILRIGTTIISARGTVGKCAMVSTPMAMNQSCYGIVGKNQISDTFVYYSVLVSVNALQQRGHGSVFNTITRDTFDSIKIAFSGEDLTIKFHEIVKTYFDKILSNSLQANSLAQLRDTLLPKLLSGELRIPDAEKLLEEAL